MQTPWRFGFRPNQWKILCGSTLLAIMAAPAFPVAAQIIPASRMVNWSRAGGFSGTPAGWTQYANAATSGCDSNGVTDCSSTLQNLINACPANEYVYLPAGKYFIGTTLQAKAMISLVGDGMGKTILNFTGSAYIQAGTGDWPVPTPSVNITGGSTAGSASIQVDNPGAITAGRLITITQTNPDWVHINTNYFGGTPSGWGHGDDRLMAFTTMATGIAGATVSLEDPLPTDFTNSPAITPWNEYLLNGFGVDNLTLNMTNSSATFPVWFVQSRYCWLYGVEIEYPASRYAYFQESSHFSVMNCFTHNSRLAGPNSEGLDFAENDCYGLIQNNVCDNAGFPMIILGDWSGGDACNVIAYNFLTNSVSGSTVAGAAIGLNHGPHNMFNLVEGNVCQNILADGYYGSASHNTLFRNWFNGSFDTNVYSDGYCIGLMHWQRFFNVVGNVLGTPGYSQVLFATGGSYQDGVIYRVGYPNLGNRGTDGVVADDPTDANAWDSGVTNTWINTGNYNYVTGTTIWDTNGVQTIPASLYLTGQPAWWTNWGATPWPAIGPDLPTMTNAIPAQLRFSVLFNPAPPADSTPAAPTTLRVIGPKRTL